MDQKPTNPLSKHFRRPVLYFKLPSGGRYWPNDALDLPVTGEIPVYPMTTADEITLKTPDALINGTGMVSVIQSCCPNIRDAWKMPSIDVDPVLIAIRIASYGTNMEINSTCPACNESHEFNTDLTTLITQVKCPNFDTPVEFDGLKFKLQPQEYFIINSNSIVTLEQQRIIDTINNSDLDDKAKAASVAVSMKKLLEASTDLLVKSTEYIETEDGTRVKEPQYIKEFYDNAESRVTKVIEARLEEIAKEGALPMLDLKCTNCEHEYQNSLNFDYSRFFA